MPDYDVILYDDIAPMTAWDPSKPMGGSEMQVKLLLEGLRISDINAVGLSKQKGVEQTELSCKTLIINRYSQVPTEIHAKHIVVLVQDKEPHLYRHLSHLPHVFVSRWQQSQFANGENDCMIYPIIGQHVYDLKDKPPPKTNGRFIYASAGVKGLRETLRAWQPKRGHEHLVVTSTGYDAPPRGFCEAYDATWIGKFNPQDLAFQIAISEGMFFRNTYQECFPVTAHIAHTLGCVMDVQCLGHEYCGVQEAMRTLDLRAETIIPQWLEFLKL